MEDRADGAPSGLEGKALTFSVDTWVAACQAAYGKHKGVKSVVLSC